MSTCSSAALPYGYTYLGENFLSLVEVKEQVERLRAEL